MTSTTCQRCGRPTRPGQELCNRCIDREASNWTDAQQPRPASLPGCVIAYAVLLLLAGIGGLCGGLFLFFTPPSADYAQITNQWRASTGTDFIDPQTLIWVNAIVSGLSGLFYLLMAAGLFLRQNWARWGVIVLNGLNVLFSLAPMIVVLIMPNISPSMIFVALCALLPALLINGYIAYWFLFHGEYFTRAPQID